MHKLIYAVTAAFLAASGTAMAADRTIDEFEAAQQAAWDAHDAAAYTAAFDANVDIITSLGWHWTGQADAARNVGDGFRFVYAGARLQVSDVQTRMLTPELASVTLRWVIDGARTLDTGLVAVEQHGFETQLLQRRGDSWIILVQQDTATAASSPPSSPSPTQAAPPVATFPTTAPPVRRCIMARKNGDCLIYGKAK